MFPNAKIEHFVRSQQEVRIKIEELYKISGKVIRYKENFSYVDKDDLNEAILTLLNSNIYKKACFEIGEYNSTNVDYINDDTICEKLNMAFNFNFARTNSCNTFTCMEYNFMKFVEI
jgi:hypothetical protein